MRLFPAADPLKSGVAFCIVAVFLCAGGGQRAHAQQMMPGGQSAMSQQQAAAAAAMLQAMGQQQGAAGIPGVPGVPGQTPQGSLFGTMQDSSAMTEAELETKLKDKDSPQYKADRLASQAKANMKLFGAVKPEKDNASSLLDGVTPPPEMETLQNVAASQKGEDISDDPVSKDMSIDIRRDAQKEAARSYGARGGLAKRSYQIMERLNDYQGVLNTVFNFRQLLIRAPSGLMIEPPIVHEDRDATVITDKGEEAAVADQVLKINQQARIVTAPRDWRQYLILHYDTNIAPPPHVLWPKNKDEQAEWDQWVHEGWKAGYAQGEDIFEANLNQLVADYDGMVRYRMLLAQGKISQPFAMQEDRGITGGKSEMRVGDRALRITGPSEFLTGANLWKPADR